MTNFEKVKIFMKTFGQEVKEKSSFSSDKINKLRFNLIKEEMILLRSFGRFQAKWTEDKPWSYSRIEFFLNDLVVELSLRLLPRSTISIEVFGILLFKDNAKA